MDICIDFDGTCVTHEFPRVGKDIGAAPVLRKLVEAGHRLILFTMRGNRPNGGDTGNPDIMDVTGMYLDDAVNWFKKNDIPLYGINENPEQKQWTSSPKAYADMYIDDAALGCPLHVDIVPDIHEGHRTVGRPYVDWKEIEKILIDMDIIPEETETSKNNETAQLGIPDVSVSVCPHCQNDSSKIVESEKRKCFGCGRLFYGHTER